MGFGLTFWVVQKGHLLRAPGKASWRRRWSTMRSELGAEALRAGRRPWCPGAKTGVTSSRSRGAVGEA